MSVHDFPEERKAWGETRTYFVEALEGCFKDTALLLPVVEVVRALREPHTKVSSCCPVRSLLAWRRRGWPRGHLRHRAFTKPSNAVEAHNSDFSALIRAVSDFFIRRMEALIKVNPTSNRCKERSELGG